MTNDASGCARIFLSHTTADAGLARAVQEAVEGLCPGRIQVHHSSRVDSVGGVPTGANWFSWIGREVRDAELTLALLTPASSAKPWLLWETGAVFGAAYATGLEDERPLWPILFRIKADHLPGPLTAMTRHARDGEGRVEFGALLDDLLELLGVRGRLTHRDQRTGQKNLELVLDRYQDQVAEALRLLPITPTEGAIQEWCARLDDLLRTGRAAQVEHFRDWLDIAFGRDVRERPRPLDARIHRRLGHLYIAAKRYDEAAQQFRLTAELAPRDIFVLRTLGEAAYKAGSVAEMRQCLDEIQQLDSAACSRNEECAALLGKYHHRLEGNPEKAVAIYERAAQNLPQSYYIRDLWAQALLALGQRDAARAQYKQVLQVLAREGDRSMWAHASAASAALVTGAPDEVTSRLRAVASWNPSPDSVEVIEGALRESNQLLLTAERLPSDLLRVPLPETATR